MNVNQLGLRTEIINELKQNNILETKQLCNMKRTQLLKLGLTNEMVEQIQIKLQLQGMDIAR